MKFCKTCGKPLAGRLPHAKYCSTACSRKKSYKYVGYTYPSKIVNATATVGTISELIVIVDLLRKGYEVFRAVSPSCSCDLICQKDGNIRRIEVKTGYYKNGVSTVGEGTMKKLFNTKKFDILAIVTNLEVKYIPELKGSDEG